MELNVKSYNYKLKPSELFEVSGGCVIAIPHPHIHIEPYEFDDYPKSYDVRPLFDFPSKIIAKMGMMPCEVRYN